MNTLLADASKTINSWNDVAELLGNANWISKLVGAITTVLWISLILVGAIGGIYAIFIGIKMAKAESAEQREEAKKHLINIIISIVVVIALILFFNVLLPMILGAFGVFDELLTGSVDKKALALTFLHLI